MKAGSKGSRRPAGPHDDSPWVDAMALFAARSRYADFVRKDGAVRRYPVLLELHRPADLRRLRAAGVDIPKAYGESCRHVTANLYHDELRRLKRGQWKDLVRRWELQLPVIPVRPAPVGAPPGLVTRSPPMLNAAQEVRSQSDVLIGIIDTGCPFAHSAYQDARLGTRVLRLWDQDAVPALMPLGACPPPGFDYGAEVIREQLNAWMLRHRDHAGAVDEDACYRSAGYGVAAQAFTHGSAVIGLAAHPMPLLSRYPQGPDRPPPWVRDAGAAACADIVFVQLPRDVVQDSSSAGLLRPLLDGLRYIVDCAGPEVRRVVVNISDGTSRTLHDGSSIIERAMAQLVADAAETKGIDLFIALAAGNTFADARHARLSKGREQVQLLLPVECEAATFVTLRIPPSPVPPRLILVPPGLGGAGIDVAPGQVVAWPDARRASCWAVYPPARGDMPIQALIAWAPTRLDEADRLPATPGRWTIGMKPARKSAGLPSEPLNLWISKNQQNVGMLARGRQACFLDVDARYDPERPRRRAEDDPEPGSGYELSAIRRRGSLNGLATLAPCASIKVVGSAMMLEARPSLYSSEGPAAGWPPGRMSPDSHYPTDLSRVCAGVRAPAARSGAVVRVAGTSFAAPQAVRDWANGHSPQAPKLGRRRSFPT